MNRSKHTPRQLPLFEPAIRWSNISLDIRDKIVDQVAQLLVQARQTAGEHSESPSATQREMPHAQENNHES